MTRYIDCGTYNVPCDNFVRNFSCQIFEGSCSFQVTKGSVVIVAGYAVISRSLNVEGDQVDTRERYASVFEKMVSDFTGNELIESFHRSRGQTAHKFVH